MFESNALASDLDWMLQSGQASSEMLIEAMLEEYFESILGLAQGWLKDPERAEQAALDVFASALLNIYRYRSAIGVRVWLYQVAVEVLRTRGAKPRGKAKLVVVETVSPRPDSLPGRALDSLPERPLVTAWLHYGLDCSVPQTSRILKVRESEIESLLEEVRQAYRLECSEAGLQAPLSRDEQDQSLADYLKAQINDLPHQPERTQERINKIQSRSYQKRDFVSRLSSFKEVIWVSLGMVAILALVWVGSTLLNEPEVPLTALAVAEPEAAQTARQDFFYLVRPGDTLQSIAAGLGTSEEDLRAINSLPPTATVAPGTRLQVALDVRQTPAPTPTLVNRVDLPPALNERSQPNEVLERMALSSGLWQTLWMEAQVTVYGSFSYLGPPMVYRSQAWVSQPDQGLELFGPFGGEPLSVSFTDGKHVYYTKTNEKQTLLDPAGTQAEQIIQQAELRKMIFPDRGEWVEEPAQVQIMGKEEVANRAAVVVDWTPAGGGRRFRLWVDALTGLVLRQQAFSLPNGQKIELEVALTQIALNRDFPPNLFDPQVPWAAGWPEDETARPLKEGESSQTPELVLSAQETQFLPLEAAPPGFDPSGSQLVFQLPPDRSTQRKAQGLLPFDLFADGYWLGTVDFLPPWSLICSRSQDGKKIAFAAQAQDALNQGGSLTWFHLENLGETYQPMAGFEIHSLAFAPDSQHLAVFASDPTGEAPNGIYLLNIGTGETQLIQPLLKARSLVWNPQGTHLALIGSAQDDVEESVMVLMVNARQITFQAPLSPLTLQDLPTADWGVAFPLQEEPGLEACAMPPNR